MSFDNNFSYSNFDSDHKELDKVIKEYPDLTLTSGKDLYKSFSIITKFKDILFIGDPIEGIDFLINFNAISDFIKLCDCSIVAQCTGQSNCRSAGAKKNQMELNQIYESRYRLPINNKV